VQSAFWEAWYELKAGDKPRLREWFEKKYKELERGGK